MQLEKDWFIQKSQDFEYHKYSVLAYIQEVEKNYNKNIVNPYIDDLVKLYEDGINYIDKIDTLHKINERIVGVDTVNMMFLKKDTLPRNKIFDKIRKILDFALPEFSKKITAGRNLEKTLENFIKLENLSVSPINREIGFLFFIKEDINIYEYKKENGNLTTKYIETKSKSNIYDIKTKYQKNNNPVSVYVVCCENDIPLETVLYLSENMLNRILTNQDINFNNNTKT